MLIVHDFRLCSVLDTALISGEDVCCSVVFDTLVCVSVFSAIWSVLLITYYAIGCSRGHQCISVRVPENGVCVHMSDDDWMWYVCDVRYAVLYIRVNCFVVRGCAVLRRYINICNSYVFNVVNMYLDHLKFCVVCINSRSYVCCSEYYMVSNECDKTTPCLVRPIGAHGGEIMYFWSVAPSVQSCCTLSISASYRVLICGRYRKPDLFVCGCRTWIYRDITRFHEEQCQPSSGSAWPACPKTVNLAPIAGGGKYRHNLHISLPKPLWQLQHL